jgi:hypothetical protein
MNSRAATSAGSIDEGGETAKKHIASHLPSFGFQRELWLMRCRSSLTFKCGAVTFVWGRYSNLLSASKRCLYRLAAFLPPISHQTAAETVHTYICLWIFPEFKFDIEVRTDFPTEPSWHVTKGGRRVRLSTSHAIPSSHRLNCNLKCSVATRVTYLISLGYLCSLHDPFCGWLGGHPHGEGCRENTRMYWDCFHPAIIGRGLGQPWAWLGAEDELWEIPCLIEFKN